MKAIWRWIRLGMGFFAAIGSTAMMQVPTKPVERLKVRIVATYPHDTGAFTQGLIWCGESLYESTGQYGRSSVRKVRLSDGKVTQQVALPSRIFGEGLAKVGNRLFQLTWRSEVALVYDIADFREVKRVPYDGEGWGLAYDGSWFIMSDGSSTLTLRDPESFAVWRRLPVKLDGRPVNWLNELECAKGAIYANIWQSTDIVRIDPGSGAVTAIIDASTLPYTPKVAGEDVLNGIAYNAARDTFLLTGKLWPKLFEVRFE